MDAYRTLLAKARATYDKALEKARKDYKQAKRDIRRLHRSVEGRPYIATPANKRNVRRTDKPYSEITTIEAADRILSEGTPLTIVELVLEIQRRGCRPKVRPARMANSLMGSLQYHCARFRRDAEGRWAAHLILENILNSESGNEFRHERGI